MNALVYVDIDQGIYKGKSKIARNDKRKKLQKKRELGLRENSRGDFNEGNAGKI